MKSHVVHTFIVQKQFVLVVLLRYFLLVFSLIHQSRTVFYWKSNQRSQEKGFLAVINSKTYMVCIRYSRVIIPTTCQWGSGFRELLYSLSSEILTGEFSKKKHLFKQKIPLFHQLLIRQFTFAPHLFVFFFTKKSYFFASFRFVNLKAPPDPAFFYLSFATLVTDNGIFCS